MPDWISVDEAAESSGYNAEHIRRLIRNKEIVAEKKGGQWWVDKKSLLVYFKNAKRSSDKRHGPKSK